MNYMLRALALALTFGLSAAAEAADDSRERIALADQTLVLAGTTKQIDYLQRTLRSRMREARASLDPEAQELLDRFLTESFKGDALQRAVRARFRENVDRAQATAAIAWLRSPVGRKVVGLEGQAVSADATAALREFEAELETRAPSSERFILVNRLLEASNQPDFYFDAARALLVGLAKGLDRLKAGDSATRLGTAEPVLATALSQSKATVDQSTFVHFLFAFRGARDADLDEYARFLNSDAGRWLVRTFQQATVSAVEDGGERAVGELAKTSMKP
ncbi:MAG TPA: hypothetical protein VFO18_15595 [Methylomirabilota bacterium]|nr:hypothetical protein [Methylomirabilota bacterium]